MIDWLKRLFGVPVDIPSPSDVVPTGNISYADGKLTVDLTRLNIPFTQPPEWVPAELEDTNSMDGWMDTGNNPLLIRGADDLNQKILTNWLIKEWEEKRAANVIVYQNAHMQAIHQIVDMKQDKYGKYFITKGVNNMWNDSWGVRPEHIQWLCIGQIN